ncbi:MAG TPA: Mov34/MPN/PAD-1 family protein [Vicinamibacterales bacterium]|nr:Mov34/MPN/PAD-1 family protein [Vicinamibacterales bacterium]
MLTKRTLPRAALRGRFFISESALAAAERLLPTYRGPDGDHEGVLFMLGFETPEWTLFTSVVAPEAAHGQGHVRADEAAVAAAARAARGHGLGVLGEIHSHPSGWTEHSHGDDELVLMPFEGMLSLVVPHYGHWGMRPLEGLGIHQYQDGRWVAVVRGIREGLTVIPSALDVRR